MIPPAKERTMPAKLLTLAETSTGKIQWAPTNSTWHGGWRDRTTKCKPTSRLSCDLSYALGIRFLIIRAHAGSFLGDYTHIHRHNSDTQHYYQFYWPYISVSHFSSVTNNKMWSEKICYNDQSENINYHHAKVSKLSNPLISNNIMTNYDYNTSCCNSDLNKLLK